MVRVVFCYLLFAFSAVNAVAQTAEERDVKRMRGIYETLYNIFQPDGAFSGAEKNYLVLMNPGIIVDPSIQWGATSSKLELDKRRAFISMIDRIVEPNWIYTPRSGEKLYDLYRDIILRDRQVESLKLTKEQEAELKDAKKIIYADETAASFSQQYVRYADITRKVAGLGQKIKEAQRADQDVSSVLANDYQLAIDELNALGNRVEIETALSQINTINNQRPEAWWAELGRRLTAPGNVYIDDVGVGIHSPKYLFYPSYQVWIDPNSTWQTITLSQSDLESREQTKKTSLSASGSYGGWFWKAGGSYSKNTQWANSFHSEDKFDLSMEVTQVVIDRPWMEARVFTSPIWDWTPQSERRKQFEGLLSNGLNPEEGEKVEGHAPFIPVTLILARNVKISSNFSQATRDFYAEQISGSVSVGWGPIRLGGQYSEDSTNEYKHGVMDNAGITMGQAQIIGMFVRVLPKTPLERKPGVDYVEPKAN